MIPFSSGRGDFKLASDNRRRLVALAVLSLAAGAATGLLAAVFRIALMRADQFRDSTVAWLRPHGALGLLVTMCLGAVAAALNGGPV
jgi:CIC family chloride channel protein